jgi:hypothetical protein
LGLSGSGPPTGPGGWAAVMRVPLGAGRGEGCRGVGPVSRPLVGVAQVSVGPPGFLVAGACLDGLRRSPVCEVTDGDGLEHLPQGTARSDPHRLQHLGGLVVGDRLRS